MRRTLATIVMLSLIAAATPVLAARPSTYTVGAAAIDITPEVSPDAPPVWLAGYGMGRQAEKAHDPIFARAMVVSDGQFGVAIVALDLVGFFYDQVEQIRAEIAKLDLKPKIDYVLISSTHTHASTDTVGIWGPYVKTGIQPGYLERVRKACIDAVSHACKSAKKAKLVIAQIDVNSFGHFIGDSRTPKVLDTTMTVIQARPLRGNRALATLVNIPCHPEVLGSRNKQLSSDFPSTLRTYLEMRFGGMTVYNSGSIGGLLAPRNPGVNPFTKEPMPKSQIKEMMAYGEIMGQIAEKALAKAEPLSGSISAKAETALLPIWNRVYKTAMGMGMFHRQVYDADGKPVEIPKTTDGKGAKLSAVDDPHLLTEVALVTIGQLQIAAIPGEIYPEITVGKFQTPQEANADFPGAPLEPTIYPLMKGKYKMVIGLANDEVGYIIPKSQWDWFHPYAYGRSKRQYGEFNSCGPEVAPRLMAAWAKLIDKG